VITANVMRRASERSWRVGEAQLSARDAWRNPQGFVSLRPRRHAGSFSRAQHQVTQRREDNGTGIAILQAIARRLARRSSAPSR
jgi:hypothetical protein